MHLRAGGFSAFEGNVFSRIAELLCAGGSGLLWRLIFAGRRGLDFADGRRHCVGLGLESILWVSDGRELAGDDMGLHTRARGPWPMACFGWGTRDWEIFYDACEWECSFLSRHEYNIVDGKSGLSERVGRARNVANCRPPGLSTYVDVF